MIKILMVATLQKNPHNFLKAISKLNALKTSQPLKMTAKQIVG
jgi:hypothetical protein